MDIAIKKVERGMGETFAHYFSELDFTHEPRWAGCFCRFYHTDCDLNDWIIRVGEYNKKEAIAEIDNGNMTGFLAFDKDKCIGWLNANHWKTYKRLIPYVKSTTGNKKVGIPICFVIHQDYRSQGVATKLLNAAIDYFKDNNYDAVLSAPYYSEDFSPKLYRGTISMYEKAGFKKIEEIDGMHIYWLGLK